MAIRQHGMKAGVAAAAVVAAVASPALVIAQNGERTISIYNIHTKETVTAVYKRNGRFDQAGLDKINRVMRDHRRDEATRMDPELIDLLWQIHNELGSREPIHLVSGYRSKASNELLRKTVGGQASESRHILGKAADVHFPDVPIKRLRYSALLQERGGVGYYPTSALPFVHVDTDRVRAWPRLPRHELALLFPSGHTRHMPADGGPLTIEDVRVAQVRYRDLAQQVAQFQSDRLGPHSGRPVAVADANLPPLPGASRVASLPKPAAGLTARLIEPPTPAIRPTAPTLSERTAAASSPSAVDRARLAQLASLAQMAPPPRLVAGPAPARRPAHVAMRASLTGNQPPPLPPQALEPSPITEPGRQIASIEHLLSSTTDEPSTPPSLGGGAWVPAPAYDDEHPDELSYRPFPIVPYLTATETEPLMSDFVAHDAARTLEFLEPTDSVPPLRFRPGALSASLLWAQQFTGSALGLDKAPAVATEPGATMAGLASRPVRTSQR